MTNLRLAFISFEFPPAVAIGGIGTYVWESARLLAAAGASVEVFTAGVCTEEPAHLYGIRVHRVASTDRHTFRDAVLPVFAARHRERPFDLIESPEIGAEGAQIAQAFPDLAVIAKLHTPSYLVDSLGQESPTPFERVRFRFGALRRGRWAGLSLSPYNCDKDPECIFTRGADEIAAPSQAIADRLITDWDLNPDRISVFQLPYRPEADMLALPVPTKLRTVGFLGRLEPRKGVVELARSIPIILRRYPLLNFRFLGPSWPYQRGDMEDWIRRYCSRYLDRITFVGPVSREMLPAELAFCDAMVLPSRWENFPFACWETLAAGRVVVGSSAGGMAEVIEPGVSGLLVPPRSPLAIVKAILQLAAQPEQLARLACSGRQRVLDFLAPERILPLQLASYETAISRAALRR